MTAKKYFAAPNWFAVTVVEVSVAGSKPLGPNPNLACTLRKIVRVEFVNNAQNWSSFLERFTNGSLQSTARSSTTSCMSITKFMCGVINIRKLRESHQYITTPIPPPFPYLRQSLVQFLWGTFYECMQHAVLHTYSKSTSYTHWGKSPIFFTKLDFWRRLDKLLIWIITLKMIP